MQENADEYLVSVSEGAQDFGIKTSRLRCGESQSPSCQIWGVENTGKHRIFDNGEMAMEVDDIGDWFIFYL